MIFAYLGPIIRKKCPEGFVLTEWTRQRYGIVTALYLSFLTLVTMFLYMVAELSALQQIMNALTGMDGLPMVIVECAVTTIYTCKALYYTRCQESCLIYEIALGGFKISFITDNIQGAMVVALSTLQLSFQTALITDGYVSYYCYHYRRSRN
jgi:Na+/proline symporter